MDFTYDALRIFLHGECIERIASSFIRIVCAASLHTRLDKLFRVWAFFLAPDVSAHFGIFYLDVPVCVVGKLRL